jgi:hypothetical protein
MTRCTVPDCNQPSGTICTYAMCLGRGMRARYVRTLHRFVGPFLGWRITNPDNDLRPLSPVGVRKGDGAHPLPVSSPTIFIRQPHDAIIAQVQP